VKVVSVDLKLNTLEEWHQDQSCLLRRRVCRNKGHKKMSLLIVLMMEPASTSETSVNFCQTTRRSNAENSHLHTAVFVPAFVTSVRPIV
jgi:hypothetical protein